MADTDVSSSSDTDDGNDDHKSEQITPQSTQKTKHISSKSHARKKNRAWLSIETTIQEINTIDQTFTIEGYLTVFWQDNKFDQEEKLLNLQKDDQKKGKKKYSTELLQYLISKRNGDEPSTESKTEWDRVFCDVDENRAEREDIKIKDSTTKKDKGEKTNKFEIRQYIANPSTESDPKLEDNTDEQHQSYINFEYVLKSMKEKYNLPFIPSEINDDDQLILFKNAIGYELIGAKPVDLDYNLDFHAFKLQIQFRATLHETFENPNNEFPFEWEFLNAQIPYRIDEYSFESTLPDFVEAAFCFDEYWANAHEIWRHSVLVRKRQSVDEWTLLKPWVDLRKKRQEYNYEFPFGLIKFRVRRNPNYYMLEIVLPLFLMVSCVFHVLLPVWDAEDAGISDRLSYIIGLLLAISAFQISIAEGLPYKSQFTLIDQYFLWAYLIIFGMVIEQSWEQSIRVFEVDNDETNIKIFVGGGLALLWIMQSFTFVLKYITATNGICKPIFHFDLCQSRDWCGLLYYITCGCGKFIQSFINCCIMKSRCKHCVKKKREKRLSIWMDMEKSESSLWDTTKQLKVLSKEAEMVLGTEKDQERYYTAKCCNGDFKKSRWDIMSKLKDRDDQNEESEKSKSMIKNWYCCRSEDNWIYKNRLQNQDISKRTRAINNGGNEYIMMDDNGSLISHEN